MNVEEIKDALLRGVDLANEHDADGAATRPAQLRRLDRAEHLLSNFIGAVREREPALTAALQEFMRTSQALTNKELDDTRAAKQLAAGETFSHPAPAPAKARTC